MVLSSGAGAEIGRERTLPHQSRCPCDREREAPGCAHRHVRTNQVPLHRIGLLALGHRRPKLRTGDVKQVSYSQCTEARGGLLLLSSLIRHLVGMPGALRLGRERSKRATDRNPRGPKLRSRFGERRGRVRVEPDAAAYPPKLRAKCSRSGEAKRSTRTIRSDRRPLNVRKAAGRLSASTCFTR